MQYNKETNTLIIFNEELKDIPEETKVIIFNYFSHFNKKVDNLPKNITHLTFGFEFNQKVDNLPQNLTYLTFSLYFNKKVDKLPQSLTYLTFGNNFNQKVDNLPQSLTHITFGYKFNQKVDKLPKNLTRLTLGSVFNQKVNNLPKNLKYLNLGWFFQNEIIIPKNLNELSLTCINNLINNLPEHIEKIYIMFCANKTYDKKVENLPITIKEIVIEDEKYKEYIKIPFGCILTIKKLNN